MHPSVRAMLSSLFLLASASICHAAPFLLEFRFFDFDGAPLTNIVLQVPGLPVESGSLPLSYVQELELFRTPLQFVFPDPPLLVTEITRDFRFDSGTDREFWTFRIDNGEGVSIEFENVIGFAGEITGPGSRIAAGQAEVEGLLVQIGENEFYEVERGGSGGIRLTVTDIPEPNAFILVGFGVMLTGIHVRRRSTG